MKRRFGWRMVGVMLALGGCAENVEVPSARNAGEEVRSNASATEVRGDAAAAPGEELSDAAPAGEGADAPARGAREVPREGSGISLVGGAASAPTHVPPREGSRVAPTNGVSVVTLVSPEAPREVAPVAAPVSGARVATHESPEASRTHARAPSDGDAAPLPEGYDDQVEQCARMRSLPQWCVNRNGDRVRVRMRGTP